MNQQKRRAVDVIVGFKLQVPETGYRCQGALADVPVGFDHELQNVRLTVADEIMVNLELIRGRRVTKRANHWRRAQVRIDIRLRRTRTAIVMKVLAIQCQVERLTRLERDSRLDKDALLDILRLLGRARFRS